VRLTRAGEIVMEHAHAIGARLASAQADLQALTAGELDPVRIGFFGRGLGALIPAICRRLDEVRPDTIIRVLVGKDDEELLGMARRGEVDLTFVQLPVTENDFDHVSLLEDEYVLVVRPGTIAVGSAARRACGDAADRVQDRQGLPAHRLFPREQPRAQVDRRLRGHPGSARAFVNAATAEASRVSRNRLSVAS
jgi:DNA-binding transcriptional LysR family regulator